MVQKIEIPDLDIDVSETTRTQMLESLPHIKASKINNNIITNHNVGVYFVNTPIDLITNLCSIDYKKAEESYGYQKVDIIHNTIYDNFKTRTEMIEYLNKEPDWQLLYNEEMLKKLPHINNYYTLLNQLPKIDSIEKLAMFLAVIRPAKKYLIDTLKKEKSWESIEDKIWVKEGDGYMYKKSHSIAFALSIVLMLNFNNK